VSRIGIAPHPQQVVVVAAIQSVVPNLRLELSWPAFTARPGPFGSGLDPSTLSLESMAPGTAVELSGYPR